MKKFKLFNYAVIFRKAKEEANPEEQYFSFVKKEEPAYKYKINFFMGMIFTPSFKRDVFAIIAGKYSIMCWKVEEVFAVESKANTFEAENKQLITPFIFKYEVKPNEVAAEKQ